MGLAPDHIKFHKIIIRVIRARRRISTIFFHEAGALYAPAVIQYTGVKGENGACP
jgi:hypothetical protein